MRISLAQRKSISKTVSMFVISFRDTDVQVLSVIHFLATCRNYNQHSTRRGGGTCFSGVDRDSELMLLFGLCLSFTGLCVVSSCTEKEIDK